MNNFRNLVEKASWACWYLVLVLFLFPIYWLFLTGFKTRLETFSIPPTFVFNPTFLNFENVFLRRPFFFYLLNSIIVASASTFVCLVAGSMAAYALASFQFRGKENLAFWFLSIRMFPPVATVIPLFLIFKKIGIYGQYEGIIFAHVLFNLPFAIWMMRGFFQDVPKELEECARVDGCSRMSAIWKVVLPVVRPGLSATGIFCFIFSWNEFLFAFLLTSEATKTLPVAAASFVTDRAILWGDCGAASFITTIPILILAVLVQRHIISGLTFGAVKA